jgi:hypothetical protein
MPTASTPPKRAREMADHLMGEVKNYCVLGKLPACYKNVDEYLYDFWPDLPWDKGALVSCQHILDAHGETLDFFQKVFNFNLREEVAKGLTEFA